MEPAILSTQLGMLMVQTMRLISILLVNLQHRERTCTICWEGKFMINIGKTCLKEPNFLIGIIIQSSILNQQMSIGLLKAVSLI